MRPLLAATVALLVALPAAARAAAPLDDCHKNHGIVAGQYPVPTLRNAYFAIPTDERVSDDCGQAIASQVAALNGQAGGRQAGAVLDDCTRHGGRLTQKFAPHALARAARGMTKQRREETRCLVGILSQLRARGKAVAISRPTQGVPQGDYAGQTGAELQDSMKKFTAALRRPVLPSDKLPDKLAGFLAFNNNRYGTGYEVNQVRRVGPDGSAVWLVTGNDAVCAGREIGGDADAQVTCEPPDAWAHGVPALAVNSRRDGTQEIWGVIPDAVDTPTVLFGGGRNRLLTFDGTGVFDESLSLPGAVSWEIKKTRHWYDPTLTPCHRDCLDLPKIPGL
ncbi:MAG: hypothetical protein QOF76_3929 [Solirubrobacteraceae bacterium]|nr:hypothetical protein [Solirubrobacteraceae bacterium]